VKVVKIWVRGPFWPSLDSAKALPNKVTVIATNETCHDTFGVVTTT